MRLFVERRALNFQCRLFFITVICFEDSGLAVETNLIFKAALTATA
jgi:hypothetical protein